MTVTLSISDNRKYEKCFAFVHKKIVACFAVCVTHSFQRSVFYIILILLIGSD